MRKWKRTPWQRVIAAAKNGAAVVLKRHEAFALANHEAFCAQACIDDAEQRLFEAAETETREATREEQ